MLPRVKIIFGNGALGSVADSADGLLGLLVQGVAIPEKFELGKAYVLSSLESLTELGITAESNPGIAKAVREFYAEAGEGTQVWLMAFPETMNMATMLDVANDHAKALVVAAKGALKGIVVCRTLASGYTPSVVSGMDSDVTAALPKAQELCEWAANSLYAPLFCIIPCVSFSGNPVEMVPLTTMSYNRVGVLVGDTLSGSKVAATAVLAGRIAASPVQRSLARVKSGAVKSLTMHIGDKAVELFGNIDLLHTKGYITFRTFSGKAGYFFTDDPLATSVSDDYALIPRRRTIDKAYRVAYATLLEELSDEVPINDDGTIAASLIKSWQNAVESAIVSQMTAVGNLGIDPSNPNDTGVECYINPSQNVAATSRINVRLRVKPYGYAKYVDVYLGFKTANA